MPGSFLASRGALSGFSALSWWDDEQSNPVAVLIDVHVKKHFATNIYLFFLSFFLTKKIQVREKSSVYLAL
jgi:hypothetical protein